jgi:hypothetical protein
MSEKSATVLHLRFKLRVPPHVFLARSREAATIIASVEGLIWKIWVLQEEEFEMGGMYLFANRETAASDSERAPAPGGFCACRCVFRRPGSKRTESDRRASPCSRR